MRLSNAAQKTLQAMIDTNTSLLVSRQRVSLNGKTVPSSVFEDLMIADAIVQIARINNFTRAFAPVVKN